MIEDGSHKRAYLVAAETGIMRPLHSVLRYTALKLEFLREEVQSCQ